jgi:hypothetical protein
MNSKKILFAGLALIPPLSIVYLVYSYGLNVPYWDQWELVPLFEKLYSGKLAISDFWCLHNEHRLFFPRIIMLFIGHLTHWDIKYEFCTNVIMAGTILFFLYSLLRKSMQAHIPPWLVAIISFLVFSPAQWENWTWGWSIQIFLNILAAVASIWALDRWRVKGLIISMTFAIVASYSFNNGLLIWIVLLLFGIQQRRSWKEITVLLGTFAGVTALYFYSYTKPIHHPSVFHFISHRLDFIKYVLAYIGSPLGQEHSGRSIVIGFFLISIMLIAITHIRRYSKEKFAELFPWLALASYAFLSACITAVGRVGFGVSQAVSSRYVTISNLFIISEFVVIALWIKNYLLTHKTLPRKIDIGIKCVVVLLIVACISSFSCGAKRMAKRKESLQKGMLSLKHIEVASDENLELLYPNADIVRKRVLILRDLQLSLFKNFSSDNMEENGKFRK